MITVSRRAPSTCLVSLRVIASGDCGRACGGRCVSASLKGAVQHRPNAVQRGAVRCGAVKLHCACQVGQAVGAKGNGLPWCAAEN